MIFDAGLILEGGGMRGVYTAGVLDFFMDSGIWLTHCYAVSAGAVNATNYLSKQPGRTFRTTVDYLNDKRYCSVHNLLTTGDLFGADFLYNRIPNELDPFDYETFKTSSQHLTAVVTNIDTGEPKYKPITVLKREMQWLRASCSLPLLSKIVKLDGGHYLDGGISDSIPLKKSMRDGNSKNIVILTQHDGYQKKPEGTAALLGSLLYRNYPQTLAAAKQRHLIYNSQLELVAEQERRGNAFVLRPKEPVTIGRAEKNAGKLASLYKQGYSDAREKLDEIMKFLDFAKPSMKAPQPTGTKLRGTCENCRHTLSCERKTLGAIWCIDWKSTGGSFTVF